MERCNNHPSIETIEVSQTNKENFAIALVTTEEINKITEKLYPKKRTDLDKIPPGIKKILQT